MKKNEKKEKPRVSVRVPQGCGVEIKGFDSLVIGKPATITLSGNVTELRDVKGENDWDNGKSIVMVFDKCSAQGPGKVKSMDDAIKASQQKV